MKTQPGLQTLREPTVSTEILCPSGCKTVVLKLSAGEAICLSKLTQAHRVVGGKCSGCHATFAIPVVNQT